MFQFYENSIAFYDCIIWLYIRILITTDDEHYQLHNCNVERHEECTQTSQEEDIIYHSWPDSIVRVMYELDTYKKYLGGRRYLDIIDNGGSDMT